MAILTQVRKAKTKHSCDDCKEVFTSDMVKLSVPADNIHILTPVMPFVYVDKDNRITGGSEQPSKEKGDRILTCPLCDQAHLFGFNSVLEEG